MTEDKSQDVKKEQRKKIMIGIFVVIFIVIIWQVKGMFSSGSSEEPAPIASAPGKPALTQQPASMPTPQAATLPKPAQAATDAISPREAQLMQLQQETQKRYIDALNELQMLKLSREIAETTQAIMSAKLATVAAQKNIIDMLTPPAPPKVTQGDYAQGLVNPGAASPMTKPQQQSSTAPTSAAAPFTQTQDKEIYTVVSVSKLQGRWSAVVGFQQDLYSVNQGDVLAPDGSKVVSIGKGGVILMKNGVTRKVSMVPII